eukprot:1020813-Pyramimonas_sp.AAC.1
MCIRDSSRSAESTPVYTRRLGRADVRGYRGVEVAVHRARRRISMSLCGAEASCVRRRGR